MRPSKVVGFASWMALYVACNDARLGSGPDSGAESGAAMSDSAGGAESSTRSMSGDAGGNDSGASAASCQNDSDCIAGQRCGFTSAIGCSGTGVCVETQDASAGLGCIDPGGRCGCDGQYVDIFCGGAGGTTEFTTRPGHVGPCPGPAEGGMDDGGAPLSCQPGGDGLSNCGPNRESCCTSPLVAGGTFYRSYDGVTFTDKGNPATVSDFRLDKYEITVGRFRQFVNAVVASWKPAAGSGKHTHLNGGQGLADSASAGSFETGWDSSWNNNLSTTSSGWNANLDCVHVSGGSASGNWTPLAGNNETLPINCLNWYQAYAFCMWDGGFLPSEAEWNYAASGGSDQRVFPWSNPPSSQTIDCTYANYDVLPDGGTSSPCVPGGVDNGGAANKVGSESPKGDGKWGHSDLVGNIAEWTLDWSANYAVPCTDCVYWGTRSQPVSSKVDKGGTFNSWTSSSLTQFVGIQTVHIGELSGSYRDYNDPTANIYLLGSRCARTP